MRKLSRIVIFFMLVVAGFMGISSLTSDNALAGTVKGGMISSPGETWDLADSPYWIEDNLTIESGASLTIHPGVEVRFDGYYSIFVDGNLSVLGIPSNRIEITSNKTDPAHGDWNSIYIHATGHAEIRYCSISYGYQGIKISNSKFNNIIHNDIMNNSDDGIFLDGSSNNTIRDNNVMNNYDDGIFLSGSSNNTITYNTVMYNGHDGIYILGSSYNTIANNNFWYNFDGIRPQGAFYNDIFYNNASNNHHGISFESSGPSNNNTVMGNNITNNAGYGLFLPNGADNRIYLNRFINNSVNAFDNTGNNSWNSTYPIGGNYWDDYVGADKFSNPNQDSPGGDGIGDVPYLGIQGGSGARDYYPLLDKPGKAQEPFYTIFLQPASILVISLAVAVGLFVGTTEFGKYKFLLLFIPLYTRIKKEKVLDHFLRGRLYEHIRKNPGNNYSSIKREFGLKNGSLGHHLYILERQEYIKSKRDGKYTRFYPIGMKIPEKPKMILSPVQKKILDVITMNQKITQKEIADALDIRQQVVSYHVNLMIESRILRAEKEDNVLRYFPGEKNT